MSDISWGLWKLLLNGVWITVQLTVYSAALGVVVAFGIGMARTHRLRIVRFLSGAYFEIFRGTSALILMFCCACTENFPSLQVISILPSIDAIATPLDPDIGGL